jgi:hypothetical protein
MVEKILRALAITVVTASIGLAAVQAPDAAAHKQWMNDASDAQEDYRFAVSEKNAKAAVDALAKLEGLMARTEDYWTAKKEANGVRLARDARALAARGGAAAKAGDMAAASDAFEKMGATCNSCHDLQLEKK